MSEEHAAGSGCGERAPRCGAHRKRREPSPWPEMLLHQDGSTHEWVPGKRWDLVVTMDDATNAHYSMLFCGEEGTRGGFLVPQARGRSERAFKIHQDRLVKKLVGAGIVAITSRRG